MWSKYHPLWGRLKDDFFELLSLRLEAGVLAFALGLLIGFTFGASFLFFILALLGIIAFYFARKKISVSFVLLILTAFFFGLGWAQGRLRYVQHPVLSTPLFDIEIKAEIQENLILPDRQILTLEKIKWPRPSLDSPEKIRLTLNSKNSDLKVGDILVAQVSVFPVGIKNDLKSSAWPQSYFQGIGARGYISKIKKVIASEQDLSFLKKIRQKITHQLLKILPDNQARIAIPLITGEQKFISQNQYKIYRQAGITHVLSVSGFHMALLAGFLFFIIRSFCVFIPYITLNFNAKKIAAIFAWIGTLFYLFLSGCQVPAVRSFGMISLVFLGILVDRSAFSKNSLFLVALALLLFAPENILSISFQLSFLSVLILISVHEIFQKRSLEKRTFRSVFMEFLMLNLAINLGLLPLIAWHFNLVNPYGIFGNLILSFLFSLGIMPSLFVGCLLIPLGLDAGFFMEAGQFISFVEQVCQRIGVLPFSEIYVPNFSACSLFLIVLAIVFLCLSKYWGKIIAFVLVVVSGISLLTQPQADILIQGETIQWRKKNHLFQNNEGQEWLLNHWQKQRGFSQAVSVKLPDVLEIQGHKIALSSHACLGAEMAFLSHEDSYCRIPVFIRSENHLYQLFTIPLKITIKDAQGIVSVIKP